MVGIFQLDQQSTRTPFRVLLTQGHQLRAECTIFIRPIYTAGPIVRLQGLLTRLLQGFGNPAHGSFTKP